MRVYVYMILVAVLIHGSQELLWLLLLQFKRIYLQSTNIQHIHTVTYMTSDIQYKHPNVSYLLFFCPFMALIAFLTEPLTGLLLFLLAFCPRSTSTLLRVLTDYSNMRQRK